MEQSLDTENHGVSLFFPFVEVVKESFHGCAKNCGVGEVRRKCKPQLYQWIRSVLMSLLFLNSLFHQSIIAYLKKITLPLKLTVLYLSLR
jgi:hypothetical protein